MLMSKRSLYQGFPHKDARVNRDFKIHVGHFTAYDKLRFVVSGFTSPVCPHLGLTVPLKSKLRDARLDSRNFQG